MVSVETLQATASRSQSINDKAGLLQEKRRELMQQKKEKLASDIKSLQDRIASEQYSNSVTKEVREKDR